VIKEGGKKFVSQECVGTVECLNKTPYPALVRKRECEWKPPRGKGKRKVGREGFYKKTVQWGSHQLTAPVWNNFSSRGRGGGRGAGKEIHAKMFALTVVNKPNTRAMDWGNDKKKS